MNGSPFSLFNPASPHRPAPTRAITNLVLIILCGDVESNLGPRACSVFPCRYCESPVEWEHKAIMCELCKIWYHTNCIEMCTAEYERLADSSIAWICPKCNSVNSANTIYHQFELELSNVYHPLNNIDSANVSLPSLDSVFSPVRYSSPNMLSCRQIARSNTSQNLSGPISRSRSQISTTSSM